MKDPEYYQSLIPPMDRPDGREATPGLLRLRSATRALRNHLDDLPVDYNQDLTGDRFLAGMGFMYSRQRYGCAESLIGGAMGGTVLGAMARSLFVDGLRWRWIGEDPEGRRPLLLGDLLEERNKICEALRKNDVPLRNLSRWLMPIPPVADLTGESLSWLATPPLPGDEELLSDFLYSTNAHGGSAPTSDPLHLLDTNGLRGAVMVLAFAGHGNYLGHRSCLTEDGQPGHDLRDIYEALFMQVAAAGVVTVLHGTAAAVPELWPADVPREPFMTETMKLAGDVAKAARPIHQLFTTKPRTHNGAVATVRPAATILNPRAIVASADVTPFRGDLDATIAEAERFWTISRATPVSEEHFTNGTTLHESLNYGGAYSNLDTCLSTYDKVGSGPISVFAARMLLEEAARLRWRFGMTDEKAFAERATQYFDEFRAHQRTTINKLRGNGVSAEAANRLFELPSFVQAPPPKPPTKNPQKIPHLTALLREFGQATQPRDPGWVVVAYSLLSQVTHATTLGCLHAVRYDDDEDIWHGNELSPELLTLSLDVACIGGAYLIGHSALMLTELSEDAKMFRASLLDGASRVHHEARNVHGLG